MSTHWTIDDYTANLCSFEQVGQERQAIAPIDDGDMPASERLKRDALVAYKSLGGPEYLKRNPELLDKALLKMIAEPPQKTEAAITIKIDAPWMNPDRLSYQREVIDAEVVTPVSEQQRAEREARELAEAQARHSMAGARLPR